MKAVGKFDLVTVNTSLMTSESSERINLVCDTSSDMGDDRLLSKILTFICSEI